MLPIPLRPCIAQELNDRSALRPLTPSQTSAQNWRRPAAHYQLDVVTHRRFESPSWGVTPPTSVAYWLQPHTRSIACNLEKKRQPYRRVANANRLDDNANDAAGVLLDEQGDWTANGFQPGTYLNSREEPFFPDRPGSWGGFIKANAPLFKWVG